jgi:hypothetical protein
VGGGKYARFWKYKSPVLIGGLSISCGLQGVDRICGRADGGRLRVVGGDGMGGIEESNLVVAPAASLRPSAERNPLIRMKPRMNGAPGSFRPFGYGAFNISAITLAARSVPMSLAAPKTLLLTFERNEDTP